MLGKEYVDDILRPSHAQKAAASNLVLSTPDETLTVVGVKHDAPFVLPHKCVVHIKRAGKQHGFWYEGDGGDRAKIERRLGDVPWSGSWDKAVKSDSSDFYYALFSNSKDGTRVLVQRIASTDKTILAALTGAGDSIAHEALHGKATSAKLIEFLRACGGGLLAEAQKTAASKAALLSFIQRGEALMWPENWRASPNAASKVANNANKIRLTSILNKQGVFFVGADHLDTLRTMNSKLREYEQYDH